MFGAPAAPFTNDISPDAVSVQSISAFSLPPPSAAAAAATWPKAATVAPVAASFFSPGNWMIRACRSSSTLRTLKLMSPPSATDIVVTFTVA